MNGQTKFNLGKSGLTDGVIDSLILAFKNHGQVRVYVMPSLTRDKSEITKMADEIVKKLKAKTGKKSSYRVIGFTIVLNR